MLKYIVGIIIILVAGGAYWWFFMNNTGGADGTQNTDTGDVPQALQNQVQAQDVKVGTGRTAEPNTQVSVEYEGRLENGTVFDSSANQGKPLTFVLGAPGIIPGFQIGVNGMKEGGERAILIPPELAYGAQEVGTIPPNSKLLFLLKLVKVEDAPAEGVQ